MRLCHFPVFILSYFCVVGTVAALRSQSITRGLKINEWKGFHVSPRIQRNIITSFANLQIQGGTNKFQHSSLRSFSTQDDEGSEEEQQEDVAFLDPLEYLESPQLHEMSGSTTPISDTKTSGIIVSDPDNLMANGKMTEGELGGNQSSSEAKRNFLLEGLPLDEQLLLEEAHLLQNFPEKLLLAFVDLSGQYALKLSLLCGVIHLMLLPIVLKFVMLQLHESIVPFLYIAPILVLFPYISLWLWENNIDSIPTRFLDEKLMEFVSGQQNSAFKMLPKEEETLRALVANSTEYAPEKLKRVVAMRLLTKIDPQIFTNECLTIKKMNRNPLNNAMSSGRINLNQDTSLLGATKAVLQSLSSSGFADKNDLIEQLKQLRDSLGDEVPQQATKKNSSSDLSSNARGEDSSVNEDNSR